MRTKNLADVQPELRMAVKCWRELIDAESPISEKLIEFIEMAERWGSHDAESDEALLLHEQAEIFRELADDSPLYDSEVENLVFSTVGKSIESLMFTSTSTACQEVVEDLTMGPNARTKTRVDELKAEVARLDKLVWDLKRENTKLKSGGSGESEPEKS
jgi:hypothetical protein